MPDPDRIQPYVKNPRYWQYKGEPVLLLGGTVEDNLYQIPDLEEHLDLLKSVGGNYIRNTMSCRDDGNVWMFKQVEEDKYDLDQWDDEHWERFEKMLKLTAGRTIFPQIEIWAFHDFNGGQYTSPYARNPWRPCNNVNYTEADYTLRDEMFNIGAREQQFFFTVPALNNDERILKYQQRFVDKILSYSLRYNHVLYCITNEIHNNYSPEWGWYWAKYIREKAADAGKEVEVTEMQWETDLKKPFQRHSLDHPDKFTFFEASQNSAMFGQVNRDNLLFAYDHIKDAPRPINHVKIYGATESVWEKDTDDKAISSFWRNIFGGSASSRFHRPAYGLGLNEKAQASLKSMRVITGEMDLFNGMPLYTMMDNADENSSSVFGSPGKEYAVYLAPGDVVRLDLSDDERDYNCQWLDIASAKWALEGKARGGGIFTLTPPSEGHWAVLIKQNTPN